MEIEKFFRFSSVTQFLKTHDDKIRAGENTIMDYDARSYIRVMKLMHTNRIPTCHIDSKSDNNGLFENEINKSFYIRCYLPKKTISTIKKKTSEVVIMINGLNELKRYDFYDIMGEYFADNDIAAILLPTPYNLNRRMDISFDIDEDEVIKNPSEISFDDIPELFHSSYLRSYIELDHLQKLIRSSKDNPEDHDFYNTFFEGESTKISLLGYSLGGLKALGYFLYSFPRIPTLSDSNIEEVEKDITAPIYKSCITFNSGVNLSKVKTERLKIDENDWRRNMEDIKELYTEDRLREMKKKYPNYSDLIDLNRVLYFEYDDSDDKIREYIDQTLENAKRHYLAISAGDDPIVSTDQIQFLSEKPVNQIIVSGVDHHPAAEFKGSLWYEYLPSIQKQILEFVESCEVGHYNKTIIVGEIYRLILTIPDVGIILASAENKSATELLNIFRKKISRHHLSRFNKFYYLSKAFYPNFKDIIDKINRKKGKQLNGKNSKK